MSDQPPRDLAATVTYWLGIHGIRVTDRFAAAIDAHDLKPKHVGLLNVLAAGAAMSQLELARTLRVAPSLVVSLADHLQSLGAVRRERDPNDRRRQIVAITAAGQALLARCTAIAVDLDAQLAAGLDSHERATLHRLLTSLSVPDRPAAPASPSRPAGRAAG